MRKIKKAFKKHVAIMRELNINGIRIVSVRRFKSPSIGSNRYMFSYIYDNKNSIGAYPPLPKHLVSI